MNRFEWMLLVLIVVMVGAVATAVVLASDEPICPDGQQYVYTHTNIVGRVQIPQYACREAS